ncbi:HTH-type transcriptional regulator VirS (plasmid) [Sulfitobacter sp. THAF37]|uniref:AraC family transcriptional regulator n=1 Tax=Sulfitobacter sp. THAF37 TaxID=2587855 RepID=UPI0012692C91|nr:AraC family transcriptional regulator [Sulfitobacter sp. THAF37]QFT61171.1 HTH-type transcriptional regulator VirS [Sulfitobacter sp. THAF37]
MKSDSAAPPAGFSSVRACFLTAVVSRFEATGTNAHTLLNRTGITLAQLNDPYGAIPLPQFIEFLEAAAVETGDDAIGVRIGSQLTASDMGPIGIVLALSGNIETGISRFASYANALQDGAETQWLLQDDLWVFTYRLRYSNIWPRRQDAECSLVSLVQVVRDNFKPSWSPQEVHFEHSAPADPRPLERFFRCPIRFSQPFNRFIADREACLSNIRTEDTALLDALQRHVEDIIGAGAPVRDISGSVTAVINASLGISPVTINHAARALSVSPRSLQRHLQEEGTSFRALLETTRRERAQMLLSQPRAKVARVAEALGYADATAFWRAWHKWTGTAPTDYMKDDNR